jgi:hypothetical protein
MSGFDAPWLHRETLAQNETFIGDLDVGPLSSDRVPDE